MSFGAFAAVGIDLILTTLVVTSSTRLHKDKVIYVGQVVKLDLKNETKQTKELKYKTCLLRGQTKYGHWGEVCPPWLQGIRHVLVCFGARLRGNNLQMLILSLSLFRFSFLYLVNLISFSIYYRSLSFVVISLPLFVFYKLSFFFLFDCMS